MKIYLSFILFVIMAFIGCNKKPLPQIDEKQEPVFYFSGDVDGMPVNIKAGLNGYYMKSSYYLDSNSIYVYKAELKQKSCSDNCGYGLTFLINDYKTSNTTNISIDSTLLPGFYQYNDGSINPLYYQLSFVPTQTAQSSAYKWTFSDNSNLFQVNSSKTIKANTNFTTTLLVNNSLFGSISHSNVYKVGSPLQTNIDVMRINQHPTFSYKFSTINTSGTPPFYYFWEFGDGQTSTLSSPNHEYTVSGLYTSKLTIVDANHDTCYSYYQIPAFNGTFGEANFKTYFSPIQNTTALSAVSVFVNDSKGNVYSLNNINQNNSFQIVSAENYDNLETNQPLKKIRVKFNCNLKLGGNSINITNGDAVIAIAYKN